MLTTGTGNLIYVNFNIAEKIVVKRSYHSLLDKQHKNRDEKPEQWQKRHIITINKLFTT